MDVMYRNVKAYFSPGRNPVENVIGFIDRTKKTLDVAMFSLTDPELKEAVKRALARKIQMRLLADKEQAIGVAAMAKTLDEIRAAGGNIRLDKGSGFMHSKYAISDKLAVLTGSYNWTERAEKRNCENLLVVRKKSSRKNVAIDQVLAEFQGDFEAIWLKSAP